MLWISELFLWVIFLCFEPCWHIFLDHELNDFIIGPREAAIAYVGKKSLKESVHGDLKFSAAFNCFLL